MAVYFLVGASARRKLSLFAYVWPVYASAALLLFSAGALTGTPLGGFSSTSFAYMFLLGLIPQCVGHTTYNWSLRWLSPGLVALIGLFEPIGASVLAYLILHESPGTTTLLGGGIILAGIYLATTPETRRK